MTIGDNLKKIRKEKKLTQIELANKIGISRSYLSDVENNRYNPSTKTVRLLADKLNVSMLYLTTGEKTINDLFYEEATDIVKTTLEHMKREVQDVMNSELTAYEVNFLYLIVRFIKTSNKENIVELTRVILSLIKVAEQKDNPDIKEEELNPLLESELRDITTFLNDYFFNTHQNN